MARAIMIQGTASNVGKSVLCAALCRIFRQDGLRAAPFKAQNMALNSYVTADGLEMGRAQAMQAEAAGVAPDVRMNPVLLKPTSSAGSQVVLSGVAVGNCSAREYLRERAALTPRVRAAYESLAGEYDVIVIEGAGSPAEINLGPDEFVNMGMARIADAPVLLAGDIDRGGVFAALYGTMMLLGPEDRRRVKGLVINKFRGDPSLLTPGLAKVEQLTGAPVVGVVPYEPLDLDEEDSLSGRLTQAGAEGALELAVVRLPHLSNFTDFSTLARIPGVSLRYAHTPGQLARADAIFLPGTKNTMRDLCWLRETGMESWILRRANEGALVFGVCGGYQMLGRTISDPQGFDGGGTMRGIGLLPVDTVFYPGKKTVQSRGVIRAIGGVLSVFSGRITRGYEIHSGETVPQPGAMPLQTIVDGASERAEGCQSGNVYGTYLHGMLEDAELANLLARALARRRGIVLEGAAADTDGYRTQQYDALAELVRDALDMSRVYAILEGRA